MNTPARFDVRTTSTTNPTPEPRRHAIDRAAVHAALDELLDELGGHDAGALHEIRIRAAR